MPSCPACGADLIPPYRFCGRCGAGVPPAPVYPYYATAVPPKKDNVALIIAIVLIVLVVGSIAMSAILYVMVSGLIGAPPGGTAKPVMTLSVTMQSSLQATVLVTGIVPQVSPSNLKANVEVDTTFGTAVSLPTFSGGAATIYVPTMGSFVLSWQNVGGSGLVSSGDQFQLTNPTPLATGTIVALIFIWSDGSTIATVTWQV